MKHSSFSHIVLSLLLLLLLFTLPLSAGGSKEEKTPAITENDPLLEGELESPQSSPATPAAPKAESADGSVQFMTYSIYGDLIDQNLFSQADITMINVWGTYCSPCIREMPDLGELHREYADKGFQITGIVIDGYHQDEEKFKEQIGMARAIVDYTKADYQHMLPISLELNEAYLSNIQVVPTTFFVDSQGRLIGKEVTGSRSKEAWIEVIEGVFAEYEN
ncbi:MAG: TlpA family protein disulfide reductase [Sphaerochaetaceae bacterium]|nr:TlpA family protein disulfide reductase [Sphaerochaetaceae bacterium]